MKLEIKNNIKTYLIEIKLSGRPGSNRRHSAWKADALPTELLPQYNKDINLVLVKDFKINNDYNKVIY